jgi:hypothetical protein
MKILGRQGKPIISFHGLLNGIQADKRGGNEYVEGGCSWREGSEFMYKFHGFRRGFVHFPIAGDEASSHGMGENELKKSNQNRRLKLEIRISKSEKNPNLECSKWIFFTCAVKYISI